MKNDADFSSGLSDESQLRAWREMFDSTITGLLLLDAGGRILFANQWVCAALVLDLDALIGQTWPSCLERLDAKAEASLLEQLMAGLEGNGPQERSILSAKGQKIPVQSYLKLMEGDCLPGVRVMVWLQDRREAEVHKNRLLNKYEHYNRLLLTGIEKSPVSIVISDEHGTIEYVNRKFTELTGYDFQECVGQNPRILKSGVQDPSVYQQMWETLLAGKTWNGVFCNRKKNGDLYWEKAIITPVRGFQDSVHYLAVKEDITEWKNVQEMQSRFTAVMNQSTDVLVILDTRGHLQYANPAFALLSGAPIQSWIGRRLINMLPRESRKQLLGEFKARLASGQVWKGRLRLMVAEGSPRLVSANLSWVEPQGQTPFIACTFRDITHEVELERHLREVEKMEAMGALANGIANEFNNVLTTIFSSAELIEYQMEDGSPLKSSINIILQATHRARELNHRILNFIHPSEERNVPFDLSILVEGCIGLVHRTSGRNLSVQSFLTPSMWTSGDPAQINQAVMNMVMGSLDLLREPDLVELELLPLKGEGAFEANRKGPTQYLSLAIRVRGCSKLGVDAVSRALLDTVAPLVEELPGTESYLGLKIAHGIVIQHGGSLIIEDWRGQGVELKVTLPAVSPSEVFPVSEDTNLQGTEHVFLVDLDEIRGALAKGALQSLGYRVTSLSDPMEAFSRFKEHPGGFDVAILAYEKGVLASHELARRMKKMRATFPIIWAADYRLAQGAGTVFDEILAKPFGVKDLGRAIRSVLKRGVAEPLTDSSSPVVLGGLKILLADDSHVTRGLLRSWLLKAGYQIREARDGQEAWDIYREAGQGHFAMLLTDVVMPRMDGVQLVERIRDCEPDIPVMLFSSTEDMEAMRAAIHFQVNEYLIKPFEANALLNAVERLSSLLSTRRQSAQTVEAVRQVQKALVASPVEHLPIYMVQQSLTDAGGDVLRIFPREDGTILLVIGDVAGHSVVSSYAVAAFLGLLSSLARQESDLSELTRRLNRGIQEGPFSEIPVCTLLVEWAPATGRLHLVNAGLPHGLIWDGTRCHRLEINGTPLGIFDEALVEEKVIWLEEGSRLFFGSDGFFDIKDGDGRLMETLAPELWESLARSPIKKAVSIMVGAAQSLMGNRLEDDLLVLGFEQSKIQTEGLRLWIKGDLEAIDDVIVQLEGLLDAHPRSIPLTRSRRFDIVTAAREALTNAFFHGNGGRPDSKIFFYARWALKAPQLMITVVDEGPGIDLKHLTRPTDPLSERGRGFVYLQSVASGLSMCAGELKISFNWGS